MLKNLFDAQREDVCPNCGAQCFATDVLCPKCGKKLDELFEQLPDDWPKRKPLLNLHGEPLLLIGWVVATAIGMAFGETILRVLIFGPISVQVPKSVQIYVLWSASGIGLAVGALQWLVLRSYRLFSWHWILTTVLGAFASRVGLSLLSIPIDPSWEALLVGTAVGFCQWLVLRGSAQRSWIWMSINGLGWALGTNLRIRVLNQICYPVWLFGFPQYAFDPLCEIAAYACSGLVVGISTGLLLLWLLRPRDAPLSNAISVGIS